MRGHERKFTIGNEKYSSLMYLNVNGVCELNLNGKIVDSNLSFQEMLGYSKSELLGKHYTDMVLAEEIDWITEEFKTYDGRVIEGFECKFKNKTGKCLYIKSTIIPIWLDSELIGLFAISQDITKQKLSRQKNDYMLSHLQRIANVGSWEFDPVNQISYWSDQLFHIYGIENTGFISLSKAVQYIHPEDRELFIESAKALSAGDPYDHEFRIIRPNGDVRILHSKREIVIDQGEIRLVGTVQDITDHKRTQEYLVKSEKLSAIGQMAAGVAHEIRNPLTALKGFLKLTPKSDNPQRYIDIMEHELNRIEAVTNEILVLAKPQVKKFKLVDIVEELTSVVDLLKAEAMMKSIEICMEVDHGICLIECESCELDQVLFNLIRNAIEATPTSGKIFVQMMQCDHDVTLRIIDNGHGIPKEIITRLGEPFFTTKENGTGLGLMISQKIILEHHGTLEFSSEVAKGTTVSIVLPCKQPRKS